MAQLLEPKIDTYAGLGAIEDRSMRSTLLPSDGVRRARGKLSRITESAGAARVTVETSIAKDGTSEYTVTMGIVPGGNPGETFRLFVGTDHTGYIGFLSNDTGLFSVELDQVSQESLTRAFTAISLRKRVDEVLQKRARGFIFAVGPNRFMVSGELMNGPDLLVTVGADQGLVSVERSVNPNRRPHPTRGLLETVDPGKYRLMFDRSGITTLLTGVSRIFNEG